MRNRLKNNCKIFKIQERVWNRLQICNTWTKSDPQSFLKACEQIQIAPENVVMVWDDIWIDGWALQLDAEWKQLLWGFVHIEPIWNSYFKIPVLKIHNYIWKNICREYINNKNK
jgi:hypothetical protein